MSKLSHTSDETKNAARELAAQLRGGEVILLEGPLGAGKTTFVQGACEALGAMTRAHSSTFTVMNLYETSHPTIHTVVHVDGYRIEDAEDFQHLGLEDWLGRSDMVLFMEWPPAYFTPPEIQTIRVHLVPQENQDRRIVITYPSR